MHILNSRLPMQPDRLYAIETSSAAAIPNQQLHPKDHQTWLDDLLQTNQEERLIALMSPNGSGAQHGQHGIDTYLLHVYIHQNHLAPLSDHRFLIGSPLTLAFETPHNINSGTTYRHLHIVSVRHLDHDGTYGYYRLIAQPIIHKLHQTPNCHIDTHTDIPNLIAERLHPLGIQLIDDTQGSAITHPRLTQWQQSDWAYLITELTQNGYIAYLNHHQSPEHSVPELIITTARPSQNSPISHHLGTIRYHRALHDRTHAPILSLTEHIHAIPTHIHIHRHQPQSVSHHTRTQTTACKHTPLTDLPLSLDTPAAHTPNIQSESIDDAQLIAQSQHTQHHQYHAIAHATGGRIGDTFTLTDHPISNQTFRIIAQIHLARNTLTHLTGLTQSTRHHQRHTSTLEAGTHLTALTLIESNTPWVSHRIAKPHVVPMTGITSEQSIEHSRDHHTPTQAYLLQSDPQAIIRAEAQAGANYGTHLTHRPDDQTLIQAIGDGGHLVNLGSLHSQTRQSLMATENNQAITSGYIHRQGNTKSTWQTDHRASHANSHLSLTHNQHDARIRLGIQTPADEQHAQRQGINLSSNNQLSISAKNSLLLSTQPPTHHQSQQQHDHQQYTPSLNQTSLGGHHLTDRLTNLATGLGRAVDTHTKLKDTHTKRQDEQQSHSTHHDEPHILIDSGADLIYQAQEALIHRSMADMLTTTQQDRTLTSGAGHHQISGESTTIVADGQLSMTNAKEPITLSAHTGKFEATAKQDVDISSSTDSIEVVAGNKITLTAGGATITLEGGNIKVTAKQFTQKAGKHSQDTGGRDGQVLSPLPFSKIDEPPTFIELNYRYDDDTPVSNAPYRVEFADGTAREGTLDENGFARLEGVPKGEALVYYGEDPAEFKPYQQMESDS